MTVGPEKPQRQYTYDKKEVDFSGQQSERCDKMERREIACTSRSPPRSR